MPRHFAHPGVLVGEAFHEQRPIAREAVTAEIDDAGEPKAGVAPSVFM